MASENKVSGKSMTNILFIPSNSTQVKMFKNVLSLLEKKKSNHIKIISLDNYKKENANVQLEKSGLLYTNVDSFKTKNAYKILSQERTDVLILGNDAAPIEKSFVIAANQLKVPTILIQDGLINDASISAQSAIRMIRYLKEPIKWAKMYNFLITTQLVTSMKPLSLPPFLFNDFMKRTAYSHTYGSSGCTRIAVSGEDAKRMFIRQGVPAEKIEVTGQPRLDELYEKKFDKAVFRSKLGLSMVKKNVLLCTQPFVEYKFWTKAQKKNFLALIIQALSELPDVQLVIKLHPVEAIVDYERLLAQIMDDDIIKPQVLLVKDIDLYALINACDILMTVNSTVALEAMVLKKQVVILDFYNECKNNLYVKSGAAFPVHNSSDIKMAVNELSINNELALKLARKSAQFVFDQAYRIDGNASQRIANLVENVGLKNAPPH